MKLCRTEELLPLASSIGLSSQVNVEQITTDFPLGKIKLFPVLCSITLYTWYMYLQVKHHPFVLENGKWKYRHGDSSWVTYFDWAFTFGFQELGSALDKRADVTEAVR